MKLTKNDKDFLKNQIKEVTDRGNLELVFERDVEVDGEVLNIEYNLFCSLNELYLDDGNEVVAVVFAGQKMVFDENGTCIEEFKFDWGDRTDLV